MPRKVKLPEGLQLDDVTFRTKDESWETIERKYWLVTPLFGGGVEPFSPDPITTIRTSEIKGHLRFWWRALLGWKASGSRKALLELEEFIWGGISTDKKRASPVLLSISLLEPGKEVYPLYFGTNREGKRVIRYRPEIAHPYISFSLEQKDEGTKKKRLHPVRKGVSFRLTITYPSELKQEVEAALWAWETFGGIGARTRRGFGAVVPEDFTPPSVKQIRQRLSDLIKGDAWPDGVPHLRPESPFFLYPGSWRNLAEAYKNFRQWRNGQRGRSKWPEPDEIRRITRKNSPGHEPRHPVHKFPRGRFGLPIVFHFKDDKKGDPPDTTLKGQGVERLASPLGFKPFGEKGPVLVYVLEGNRKLPGPYMLDTPWGPKPVSVDLTPEEASLIEPLAAAGGETDPVLAFIKWLKQGGRK